MQVQSMPLAHDVCGLDRHTSNDAHHTTTTSSSSSPEREGEEVVVVVQRQQQEAQPQRLSSQPSTACPLNESTTPRLKSGGKAHGRLHTSSVSQARSNLLQRLRAQRHGEAEAPAKDHTSSTINDENEVVVGAVEVVAAAANEVKATSTQPLQDKNTCGGGIGSHVVVVNDVNVISAKTLHCDPNVATDMQQEDVRRAYKALTTTTTTTDDVNDDDESSHSDMGVSSSNSNNSSSNTTTTTTVLSSVHTACWSQEMAQAGQSSLVGVLAAEEELRQQQQRHLVLSHTHEKEDDEEEEGKDRHTSHTHVNEEVEEEEEDAYDEDGCDPLTRQCTTLCLAAHHCPHNEGCEDDDDDENEDEDHTIITCTAHEGQKEGADVTCAAADDHMSAMPRLTTVRSCDGLDADCALIQCTIQQLAGHHPHHHYLNSNTNDDEDDDDDNDGGCCSNRNNNNNNNNSYTHHEEGKYSTAYLPQSQAYNNRHYEHNNATTSTTITNTITSDESTCSTNGCSSCNHSCAGADNEEEEEEEEEGMNAQTYRDQAAHIARAAEAHQEDAEAEAEEEEEAALCVMPAENAWEANVSWQEMSPMAQIRHALRQYPHEHPFLDMRRQVMLYENHRSRQHNLYCLRMSHECMTSAADLLVASKVLVNYGHRLHLERCREHNALVARRRRERQRAGLNRVRQLCPAGGEEEEEEEKEEEEEGCDGQDTTSPHIVVVGVDEASGKEKECEDEGDEVCGEEEDEETCEEGCKAAAMPNVPATLGAALVECITNTPHTNSEDEYSYSHNHHNNKYLTKSKAEKDSMKDLAYIHSQWRTLASAMEADLDTDTQHLVQRRLSCMCIFNPDSDERRYTDNEETRERRLQRQQATLMALRLQAEAGGSPYFLS